MKILVLATYPISEPRHGGQLRVRHIVDYYRRCGHSVKIIGVLGSNDYKSEEGFLPFPGYHVIETIYPRPFLMEDYVLGKLFYDDSAYHNRLKSLVGFDEDLVHIEQPWLFGFIKKVIDSSKSWKPALIYGSANVEYELKRAILSNHFSHEDVQKAVRLVREMENDAVVQSDAVICVSEADKEKIIKLGAKQTLLLGNGVSDWTHKAIDHDFAIQISESRRYAFYTASAHPPNIVGFFDMLNGGFGSLTPDQKLIVSGGVGPGILADPKFQKCTHLNERLLITGVVEQNQLYGFLDSAHCILLPITQGGGTNLKTAEAQWSGKYILATSVAMRGFENFISAPGVFIADDPINFKRKLRDIMSLPPHEVSDVELKRRSVLLWDSCLAHLDKFAEKLVKETFYG